MAAMAEKAERKGGKKEKIYFAAPKLQIAKSGQKKLNFTTAV